MPMLYNHDLSCCTRPGELMGIPGVHNYSGRALCLTAPQDVIQLDPCLRQCWESIFEHYGRVGLPVSKNVIWDADFSIADSYLGFDLSPFFFGERAHAVRPNLGWYNITQAMNSKNDFIALCENLGVPHPETDCYLSKHRLDIGKIKKYPVYVKISTSVSGLGVFKCRDANELEAVISGFEAGLAFQIQEEVEAVAFLNVLVFGGSYSITEQILVGCAHNGNRFPVRCVGDDLHKSTFVLANYLIKEGMRGPFAFDFAVLASGESLAIECNPRFNGSTYPTMIARRLGIKGWEAKNYKTAHRRLEDIDLGNLAFDGRRGAIFYNWGCVEEGKIGVMLAGEDVHGMEDKLLSILN